MYNPRSLYFQDNRLSGPIPDWLEGYTQVKELRLDQNRFSGPIPAWLGNMAALEGVHLWGNQLTETIPSELANLGHLEVLFLGQNMLSGCIPLALLDIADTTENDLPRLGLPFCVAAPVIRSVSPSTDSITVRWNAPELSQRSSLTSYDLRHLPTEENENDDTLWTVVKGRRDR